MSSASAPEPRPPENSTIRRSAGAARLEITRHYAIRPRYNVSLMSTGAEPLALETVACNLCGADDAETIYKARYQAGQRRDLVRTFRASGDELLIDPLVRCRRCGLEYVS